MTWPRHRVILLIIVSIGLALRLAHYWAVADTSFPELPLLLNQTDLFANVEWAQAILAGDWLGQATYHPYFVWMRERGTAEAWYRWWGGQTILQQAPLYPYWVAGWFAVLGDSLKGILLVQLLVGSLDSLVIYFLARRLFDVRVGLLAAAMTALYGPFIFQQGTLLRDWLPPILEPLALLAIYRACETDRLRDWLLAGVAIGVAMLAKETLLLFLPLLFLWLIVQFRPAWPQAARAAAVVILGLVIVLSPVFIRNSIVGAPLFSISNRAAEGFIEGNAPDSEPIGFKAPDSLPGILERANGHFSAVVYETLRLYHGDWVGYMKLVALKIRAVVDPFEVPNNLDIKYAAELSPVLRMTLTYGMVFPLGLAGIVLSFHSLRRHGLLLLYGLTTVMGLLGAIILARYRLALVPVLIVYGAAALVVTFDAVSVRKWRDAAACIVLIAVLAVLDNVVWPIARLRTDMAIAHHYLEYYHSSKLYGSRKEFGRGAAEMVRMRERAEAVPDTPDNRESKVITVTVALEREAYLRLLDAIQLFEQGKREQATQSADLAKNAYIGYYRARLGFLGKPVDAELEENLGNRTRFFARLRVLREPDSNAESEVIQTVLDWLDRKV